MTKDTISVAATALRLLEAVLEQLPVGVFVVEAPSGRTLSCSGYAQALVGDDFVHQQVFRPGTGAAVPPEDRPLALALRGEPTRNELLEVTTVDGRRRLLAVTATPVRDDDDVIVAAVSVFEDVTVRARRERVEREFVANAAHELRTPVAAIASAVEVLQAGAKERPEERDRFLSHVERETWHLTRIARALLTLARAEMDVEQPRREIVALRPLLEEVASAARPTDAVELRVDCDERLAALTNRDLVEQALVNLVLNAVRYTQAGSIELSARADGRRAVVEVRDTGPGLRNADRPQAFDRFYRGGGGAGDGYGLGLSIARQAIEAAGGSIEIEGDAGRGTTATIGLQLARLVTP